MRDTAGELFSNQTDLTSIIRICEPRLRPKGYVRVRVVIGIILCDFEIFYIEKNVIGAMRSIIAGSQ